MVKPGEGGGNLGRSLFNIFSSLFEERKDQKVFF